MGGLAIIFFISVGVSLFKWLYEVIFRSLHNGMSYDEWYRDERQAQYQEELRERREREERKEEEFRKLVEEKFGITDQHYVNELKCWVKRPKQRKDIEGRAKLFTMTLTDMSLMKKTRTKHPDNEVTVEEIKDFLQCLDSDMLNYLTYSL
mgnify:FL=1